CLEKQTQRSRNRDDIGEGNYERQSGHTGELGDLNNRPIRVQGDTKTVPTDPAEEPSADPLMRDPSGGEQKGKPQIVCRSLPRRTRRCADRLAAARQHRAPFICVGIVRAWPESFRGHTRRADESNKPTPKCKTNSE